MHFEVRNISDLPNPGVEWSKVVDSTYYAWFWSSYLEHQFRLSVLKASGRFVEDRSFFVYEKDKLCGLVVLVFVKSLAFDGLYASYDKPLPWPMIMDYIADKTSMAEYMFEEIDYRIKYKGVMKASFQLSPPDKVDAFKPMFSNTLRKFKYIDGSYESHCISVSSDTLGQVRKRFRQYVRKYWELYDLSIIDSSRYYSDLPSEYMDLHVKDSGSVHRPMETYYAQLETVNKDCSFVVKAVNKSTGNTSGMLIIFASKQSAYDGSVAVDPAFKNEYVSHLMKWKAIQHMLDIGVKYYELGQVAIPPNYLSQPDDKSYGISFFKEGWSRAVVRDVFIAEKFYDKFALDQEWQEKMQGLIKYFDI